MKQRTLILRSALELYESIYNLTIEEVGGPKGNTSKTIPIEVGSVFDSDGQLHVELLKEIYDRHTKEGGKPGLLSGAAAGSMSASGSGSSAVPAVEKKDEPAKKKKKNK
jgi:hypothetical protein